LKAGRSGMRAGPVVQALIQRETPGGGTGGEPHPTGGPTRAGRFSKIDVIVHAAGSPNRGAASRKLRAARGWRRAVRGHRHRFHENWTSAALPDLFAARNAGRVPRHLFFCSPPPQFGAHRLSRRREATFPAFGGGQGRAGDVVQKCIGGSRSPGLRREANDVNPGYTRKGGGADGRTGPPPPGRDGTVGRQGQSRSVDCRNPTTVALQVIFLVASRRQGT